MRVLYLLSGPSIYDGSTKSLLNLISGLKEYGVDIYIVCPSKKGVYENVKKEGFHALALKYSFSITPGCKTIREKIFFIPKILRRFVFNNIAQYRLYLYCKSIMPDLIHSNTTAISIGYHVAKKLSIPHVWHIREYGDLDFGMKINTVNKYLVDNDNYTISITKDIAIHRKVWGRDASKVIYNGIFSKNDIQYTKSRSNYFLFAGRVQKAKGLKELVISFVDFCNSRPKANCKLLIAEGVCDKPYKKEVIAIIKEKNLTNKVEWLGNRKDLPELMSKSLAVVVPSFYEGFGRVMAEAMFNGALVIGKNTGGTQEQFDNGLSFSGEEIGLRYQTIEQCADCMRRVYDEGFDKFESMVYCGQKTAVELYSNETYVKSVLTFYKQILQAP